MTGLEQAFYIVALVYMGISLLIIVALMVAVGVIRKKVISLENTIREKLDFVTSLTSAVQAVVDGVQTLKKHK